MIICRLGAQDRQSFSCGDTALDVWFRKYARQDVKRGYSSVFVALSEDDQEKVIGFYSISAASLNLAKLPEDYARELPHYPEIPAIRLGRLAVHKDFQRKGIGRLLLFDSLRRSCASEIAWAFFLVEAKDQSAQSFYEKFYFTSFMDNPLFMWLSRKQAEKIVGLLSI